MWGVQDVLGLACATHADRMPGYAQCRSSDVGDISRPNASIMQTVSSWVVPMVAWRVLSQRKQTSSCATERRPHSVPLWKGDCAVEDCSAVEDCAEWRLCRFSFLLNCVFWVYCVCTSSSSSPSMSHINASCCAAVLDAESLPESYNSTCQLSVVFKACQQQS